MPYIEPIRVAVVFDAQGRISLQQGAEDLERLRTRLTALSSQAGTSRQVFGALQTDLNRFTNELRFNAYPALGLFNAAFESLHNVLLRITKIGFYAFLGEITAVGFALEKLGKDFLSVNEKFSGLEITIKSVFGSSKIAKDIRDTISDITAKSPLSFEGIAETVRASATIPGLSGPLARQAEQPGGYRTDGALQNAIHLVEQLVAFRPDKSAEDAIFAIREAATGQFRSLQRRFEFSPQLLASASGKSLTTLEKDPTATIKALGDALNKIISPEAVNQLNKQPSKLYQNFLEQLKDVPLLKIGKYGEEAGRSIYDRFINYLFNALQETSKFTANDSRFGQYVRRISVALNSLFDTLIGSDNSVVERILTFAGIGKQQLPGLPVIDRLFEGITRLAEGAVTKLPQIFESTVAAVEKLIPIATKLIEIFENIAKIFLKLFETNPYLGLAGLLAALNAPALVRAGTQYGARAIISQAATSRFAVATSGLSQNMLLPVRPLPFGSAGSTVTIQPSQVNQIVQAVTSGQSFGVNAATTAFGGPTSLPNVTFPLRSPATGRFINPATTGIPATFSNIQAPNVSAISPSIFRNITAATAFTGGQYVSPISNFAAPSVPFLGRPTGSSNFGFIPPVIAPPILGSVPPVIQNTFGSNYRIAADSLQRQGLGPINSRFSSLANASALSLGLSARTASGAASIAATAGGVAGSVATGLLAVVGTTAFFAVIDSVYDYLKTKNTQSSDSKLKDIGITKATAALRSSDASKEADFLADVKTAGIPVGEIGTRELPDLTFPPDIGSSFHKNRYENIINALPDPISKVLSPLYNKFRAPFDTAQDDLTDKTRAFLKGTTPGEQEISEYFPAPEKRKNFNIESLGFKRQLAAQDFQKLNASIESKDFSSQLKDGSKLDFYSLNSNPSVIISNAKDARVAIDRIEKWLQSTKGAFAAMTQVAEVISGDKVKYGAPFNGLELETVNNLRDKFANLSTPAGFTDSFSALTKINTKMKAYKDTEGLDPLLVEANNAAEKLRLEENPFAQLRDVMKTEIAHVAAVNEISSKLREAVSNNTSGELGANFESQLKEAIDKVEKLSVGKKDQSYLKGLQALQGKGPEVAQEALDTLDADYQGRVRSLLSGDIQSASSIFYKMFENVGTLTDEALSNYTEQVVEAFTEIIKKAESLGQTNLASKLIEDLANFQKVSEVTIGGEVLTPRELSSKEVKRSSITSKFAQDISQIRIVPHSITGSFTDNTELDNQPVKGTSTISQSLLKRQREADERRQKIYEQELIKDQTELTKLLPQLSTEGSTPAAGYLRSSKLSDIVRANEYAKLPISQEFLTSQLKDTSTVNSLEIRSEQAKTGSETYTKLGDKFLQESNLSPNSLELRKHLQEVAKAFYELAVASDKAKLGLDLERRARSVELLTTLTTEGTGEETPLLIQAKRQQLAERNTGALKIETPESLLNVLSKNPNGPNNIEVQLEQARASSEAYSKLSAQSASSALFETDLTKQTSFLSESERFHQLALQAKKAVNAILDSAVDTLSEAIKDLSVEGSDIVSKQLQGLKESSVDRFGKISGYNLSPENREILKQNPNAAGQSESIQIKQAQTLSTVRYEQAQLILSNREKEKDGDERNKLQAQAEKLLAESVQLKSQARQTITSTQSSVSQQLLNYGGISGESPAAAKLKELQTQELFRTNFQLGSKGINFSGDYLATQRLDTNGFRGPEAKLEQGRAQVKEFTRLAEEAQKASKAIVGSSEDDEKARKGLLDLAEGFAKAANEADNFVESITGKGDAVMSFTKGVSQTLSEWKAQLQNFTEIGKQFTTQFADGLGTAFANIVTGAKNAKDAFRDFATSFIQMAVQMLMQKAVQMLLGSLLGGFGGVALQGASAIQSIHSPSPGTTGEGFADGGLIPGSPSEKDNMLAYVASGEFVIPTRKVKEFGSDHFEKYLTGEYTKDTISHYEKGGLVNKTVSMMDRNFTSKDSVMKHYQDGGLVDSMTDNISHYEMGGHVTKVIDQKALKQIETRLNRESTHTMGKDASYPILERMQPGLKRGLIPGVPSRTDNIVINAATGEFIIPAPIVQRYGANHFEEYLQNDDHRNFTSKVSNHYDSGGQVSRYGPVSSPSRGSRSSSSENNTVTTPVSVSVTVNNPSGTVTSQVKAQQDSELLGKGLQRVVQEEMIRQHRQGGIFKRR